MTPQTPEKKGETPRFDSTYAAMCRRPSLATEIIYAEFQKMERELNQARGEVERLKRESPDPVREHFCACPNCDPVMCCNGQECGCMGLPIEFRPTDKCDGYCLNKTHHDLSSARENIKRMERELESLRADKERLSDALQLIGNIDLHVKPVEGLIISEPFICLGSNFLECLEEIRTAIKEKGGDAR